MKRRDDYLKHVGMSIRSILKLKGLTMGAVAAKVPMKEYGLNKIELGYVSCKLTTLKRIADCLEVDIKIFL